MNEQEQRSLNECRESIEQRIGWGKSEAWTHQDFISLSALIFDETGVTLSTTTLKRIWGKVKYDSTPNHSTLNALAQFAGYQDWRSFKINYHEGTCIEEREFTYEHRVSIGKYDQTHIDLSYPNTSRERKNILNAFLITLILIISASTLMALLLSLQAHNSDEQKLSSENYTFTAHPVASGLPNTVIFNYDASAAHSDSIYIQQTNLTNQKTKVSKDEHRLASMFYYPGAYQAQLLVDDHIVKKQAFQINTEGWLALVEQDPMPLYFDENIVRHGTLGVPLKTLQDSSLDLQYHIPWVSYYNVQDFGELYNDNFILETAFKSEFNQGNAVCQDSSVVILFQDAPPLTIPLSIPACLARTDEVLKQQNLQNENINLLAFGVDFSDWVQLKCEAKDQLLSLHINRKLAYQGNLPEKNSKVIGIAYRFYGNGAVNYVRLGQSDGKLIFYDDFS